MQRFTTNAKLPHPADAAAIGAPPAAAAPIAAADDVDRTPHDDIISLLRHGLFRRCGRLYEGHGAGGARRQGEGRAAKRDADSRSENRTFHHPTSPKNR